MLEFPWIVVPAHNDAAVIEATLRGIRSYLPYVVVVDDGSTDETSASARSGGAIVLRREAPAGRGEALRTGIEFALGRGATHVCTFDARGRYAAASIESMLQTMRERNVAVVLGSRYIASPAGPTRARALIRRARISAARMRTGLPLTDPGTELRLFTRLAVQAICTKTDGRGFEMSILRELARTKLAYVERAIGGEAKDLRMERALRRLEEAYHHGQPRLQDA